MFTVITQHNRHQKLYFSNNIDHKLCLSKYFFCCCRSTGTSVAPGNSLTLSHSPSPDAFPAQGSRHTATPGLSRLHCMVSGGGVALREQKSGGRGVGVIARPPSPVPQVKLRASGLSTTRQKRPGSENWPRASPLKGWPARCRNSPGWFPSLAALGSVSSCPQSYSLKGERPFLCLSVFLGDLGPGEHL